MPEGEKRHGDQGARNFRTCDVNAGSDSRRGWDSPSRRTAVRGSWRAGGQGATSNIAAEGALAEQIYDEHWSALSADHRGGFFQMLGPQRLRCGDIALDDQLDKFFVYALRAMHVPDRRLGR